MGANSKQTEIMERRMKVGDMLKRQMPQTEMAKRLGVTTSMINRDVKAILELWSEELKGKAATMRARDAQALDHLELVAQMNYENAIARRQEIEKDKDKGKNTQAWERYDRAARAWFEERLRIHERRAKLLNLDIQVQQQTNVAVQVPISFVQIKAPDQAQIRSGNPVIEGEVVDGGSDSE